MEAEIKNGYMYINCPKCGFKKKRKINIKRGETK